MRRLQHLWSRQPNRPAAHFVHGWLSFSGVRFLLGAILVIAAAQKAELLSVSTIRPFARWQLGVVLSELVFAGWLFSDRFRSSAWWAATACFGTFATVAAFKLLAGETDCGCFGVIRTPPWIALLIDTTAVAGLLITYRHRTITPQYRFSAANHN